MQMSIAIIVHFPFLIAKTPLSRCLESFSAVLYGFYGSAAVYLKHHRAFIHYYAVYVLLEQESEFRHIMRHIKEITADITVIMYQIQHIAFKAFFVYFFVITAFC